MTVALAPMMTPRFITAELTMADVTPGDGRVKPLAAESLTAAEAAIDALGKANS